MLRIYSATRGNESPTAWMCQWRLLDEVTAASRSPTAGTAEVPGGPGRSSNSQAFVETMVTITMDGQWDAGTGIPIGTEVFSADGARLGSVVGAGAYGLMVEQGWFLVRDYQAHVRSIQDDSFTRTHTSLLSFQWTRVQLDRCSTAEP